MEQTTEDKHTTQTILCCSECHLDFSNATVYVSNMNFGYMTALQSLQADVILQEYPISLFLRPGDLCPVCFAGKIQDTKREEVVLWSI